jgi:hypothetical protein
MIWLYVNILIVAGAIAAGLSSVYIFKMKQDNPIEEKAEEIIKNKTGVDIDLTPQSPEKTEEQAK